MVEAVDVHLLAIRVPLLLSDVQDHVVLANVVLQVLAHQLPLVRPCYLSLPLTSLILNLQQLLVGIWRFD